MGRHAYYLSSYQRIRATKLNLIANPFGIMAYSLPNVSVAIFINRILRLPRLQQWLLYSVPIAQCVIAGISCVLLFAQCVPAQFLWDPTVPAKCLSPTVITGYSYFVGGEHCNVTIMNLCYWPTHNSVFCIHRYFLSGRSCTCFPQTPDEGQNQAWSVFANEHNCIVCTGVPCNFV